MSVVCEESYEGEGVSFIKRKWHVLFIVVIVCCGDVIMVTSVMLVAVYESG